MKREFLKNFQVNGTPLPDAIIDAILEEHGRDLEAAKADPGANGGTGGKTFTQEEVNRIVSDRLAREREKQPKDDEREQALKAREARLDCRDYLDKKKYPVALMDVLDVSDVEKFKKSADALASKFPGAFSVKDGQLSGAKPAPADGSRNPARAFDTMIADAFKPQT